MPEIVQLLAILIYYILMQPKQLKYKLKISPLFNFKTFANKRWLHCNSW